jgi:hypothetical protein
MDSGIANPTRVPVTRHDEIHDSFIDDSVAVRNLRDGRISHSGNPSGDWEPGERQRHSNFSTTLFFFEKHIYPGDPTPLRELRVHAQTEPRAGSSRNLSSLKVLSGVRWFFADQ